MRARWMRCHVQVHREWMNRSYVATFAFVVFRLLIVSQLFAEASRLERFTVFLWMSWTVPLLVTEIVLQWRRSMGMAVRVASGAAA